MSSIADPDFEFESEETIRRALESGGFKFDRNHLIYPADMPEDWPTTNNGEMPKALGVSYGNGSGSYTGHTDPMVAEARTRLMDLLSTWKAARL